MKSIVKLAFAFAALLMAGGTTTASAQKFGYLNSNELLSKMPEMETVRVNLESLSTQLTDMMESIQVEFNNKLNDYQNTSANMTEGVKQNKLKELEDIERRLSEFPQTAQNDLETEQRKQMAPLIERAQTAITAVGKANGMTAIFDLAMGAVVYHDESTMINMLPLVVKEMGIKE